MDVTKESDLFANFDPMKEDFVKTVNSSYFGGPGFAMDQKDGTKIFNILVEDLPADLKREGLINTFKTKAHVVPLACKVFPVKGKNKAAVLVRTISDATNAIQLLNEKPPLNLRVSLAANRADYESKRKEIQEEQRKELAKHLRVLEEPLSGMGELVNNLCAVENLFKILSSRNEVCSVCSEAPLVRHVHFLVEEEAVVDPFKGLPKNIPVSCSYCSNEEGNFVVCAKCQVSIYCGLRCQALAWSSHKEQCTPHPKFTNGGSQYASDSSNDSPAPITKKPAISANPGTSQVNKVDAPIKKLIQRPAIEKPMDKPNQKPIEKTEVKPIQKLIEEPLERPIPKLIEKTEVKPILKLIEEPLERQIQKPTEKSENQIRQLRTSPRNVVTDNGSSRANPYINNGGNGGNGDGGYHNPLRNIPEPDKFVLPKKKISLNKEVDNIRETKLEGPGPIDIISSFCYSPSEFYVQRQEDASKADELLEKLFGIYAGSEDWPDARKLKVGQYCVSSYSDGYYYRAKVLGFVDDEKVSIKFIDFGNRDKVPYTALRPLPPEFVPIPALAVKCTLRNVKPLFDTGGWSKDCSRFFEDMLAIDDNDDEKPIFSYCKVFGVSDGKHYVELSNEKGETINDALVRNGHANHYEEVRKPMGLRNRRNPELSNDGSSYPDDSNNRSIARVTPNDRINTSTPLHRQTFNPIENISPPRPPPRFEPQIQPKRTQPRVEPEPEPEPQPVERLSPTEAFNRNCTRKSPAYYYHLYSLGPLKPELGVVALYNDVYDPAVVYVLSSSTTMLDLYDALNVKKFTKTPIDPTPGLFAVAPAEDGAYYRVLILDVEEEKSSVFFLDFGNVDVINNSDLLLLPSEIALDKVPAQAIRCRVINYDAIDDYVSRLAERITDGSITHITIVRKISDHEYAIEMKL